MNRISRPGYRRGLNPPISIKSEPIDIKNERRGIGNRVIRRPGFKQEDQIPRIVSFDKFQTLDIDNAGTVELGEKTLKKLLEVKIPDDTDKEWLAEKARLTTLYESKGMSEADIKKELEINKPLGREQRYKNEKSSIGDARLSFSDKLSELRDEVRKGNTLSQAERATLAGQLAKVLNNTRGLNNLTAADIRNITAILSKIKIPDDRKSFGLVPRFVDKDYYDANSGAINLLALNKVKVAGESKGYTYSEPFKDYAKNPSDGLPAKSVVSMYRKIERKGDARGFLDLDFCAILSKQQLLNFIATQGDDIDTNPLYSVGLVKEGSPSILSKISSMLKPKTP